MFYILCLIEALMFFGILLDFIAWLRHKRVRTAVIFLEFFALAALVTAALLFHFDDEFLSVPPEFEKIRMYLHGIECILVLIKTFAHRSLRNTDTDMPDNL